MKINQSAIDRLLKINWFINIGNIPHGADVILAKSSSEAGKYLADPEWENVTLEESNEISGYLAVKHTIIFQEWNSLAKEAKIFFKDLLLKVIPKLDSFDNVLLLQCIEWDIIHYLIEDAYKEKIKKPLFFDRLVSIYEAGHIPCGWDGQWPSGKLVVY